MLKKEINMRTSLYHVAAEAVSEVRRKEEEAEELVNKALKDKERTIEEARKKAQSIIDGANETIRKMGHDKDAEKKRAAEEVRKAVSDETEKDISELNSQRKKNEKRALEKATEYLTEAIRSWP